MVVKAKSSPSTPACILQPYPSQPPEPVTLVLLPGMDGTGMLFEPFIAALGDAFPITVVTYPPTADSQTYADSLNLAALALPPKGLLVLLGESFSGPIAISLAAANPKRVVGLFCAARLFVTQDQVCVGSVVWPVFQRPSRRRDSSVQCSSAGSRRRDCVSCYKMLWPRCRRWSFVQGSGRLYL